MGIEMGLESNLIIDPNLIRIEFLMLYTNGVMRNKKDELSK